MNPKDKEKQFKGKGKPREVEKRAKDSKFPKDKEPVYKKGPNSPEWRCSDEVMTKLVATLPFGLAAGLQQDTNLGALNPSDKLLWRQPGILNIGVYLTLGNSSDYNSAVNLATRKIYSYVRHANSGSRNYEAVDMGMYFGAVGQIIGLLGYLQRMLRIVKEYSATNRYLPTMMLSNMGVIPDDIISNQPRLKYLIAWLGRVLNGLAFPKLHYFDACYEAFKHIYVDNDSPKEQFYMLTCTNFGTYDPTYDANGGGVRYTSGTQWPTADDPLTSKFDINAIEAYVRARTDVLLGDEDVGIISGDILKAFQDKATGLWKPEAWDLDYDIFQYSPEVLQQIHNTNIVPHNAISFAGYKQDPGVSGAAPFVKLDMGAVGGSTITASRAFTHQLMIDAFSRQPDEKEVVNCTVLNPTYYVQSLGGSPATYSVDVATLDFDLFLPVQVFLTEDIDVSVTPLHVSSMFVRNRTTATGNLQVTNFDWHPFTAYYTSVSTGVYRLRLIGDIQNFRIFDNSISKRIHNNSMLSLLNFNDVNFYNK